MPWSPEWLGISAHNHFHLGKVTANLEESENHRMDWVGSDHTAHPVPTPCHGLRQFQGWGSHSSGQCWDLTAL